MDQEYTEIKQKIEAELERWLPKEPNSDWAEKVFGEIGKNANVESLKSLLTPVRELVSRGGKRWRPLFMSLVCETFGGGDAAIPITPIIEFAHNASLIHDDIEDESEERRGKPAIHRIYGVDTAINAGSFSYFLATACIDACALKNKEFIYKYWMENMRRLHLGQSMDIGWHQDISLVPKIEDYYLMCSLKTGSLACLPAGLGAHAAGAPQEIVKFIGSAADKIGVGFQIFDDVKNLTTGISGKKRGDDLVEGKKGLPILLYLNKYPERRERIFYFFHAAKSNGESAPEVEELIDTLTPTGVFEEAEEKGKSLIKESQDMINSHAFSGYPINDKGFTLLNNFFNTIV